MLRRGQVFVRAKDQAGRWGTCDVLDLDEVSFRAWVVDVLRRHGMVAALKDDYVAGEGVEYRCVVDHATGQKG